MQVRVAAFPLALALAVVVAVTVAPVVADRTAERATERTASRLAAREAVARSAPAGPRRVLFDDDPTRVTTVRVDGTTYRVYRYDNALPYADGVEFYGPGGRVTSERRARSVARAVGWRRAVERVDEGDLRRLNRTRERLRRIDRRLTPAVEGLNRLVALRNRLQNATLKGISAWQVATSAAPPLYALEGGVLVLRGELRAWRDTARRTATSLDYVVEGVRRARAERPVDYARLDREVATAAAGLGRLDRRARNLSTRLSTVAGAADAAVASVRSVPRVGDRAARTLDGAVDPIAAASTDLRAFADRARRGNETLGALHRTATSRRTALVRKWRVRQSARARVYGTLGVGLLALVGGVVAVRRRDRLRRAVDTGGIELSRAGIRTAALDPDPPDGATAADCPRCGADLAPFDAPAFCPECGAGLTPDARETRDRE